MSVLGNLFPGLWVLALAALLAWTLRRWFDPAPARCWAAWGTALAVMFGAVLFAGRVMLPLGYLTKVPPFTGLVQGEPPGNLLQSDLVLQIAPWLVRVREAYAAGEWPLWNALSGAGEPLLGNPQSQAFQPLAWLALPFPVAMGFGILAALRVLLALVFTFLLLRRQGISEVPSLAGSFAYGLGGFLQLWLGWPLSGSATFLPVLLYGLILVDQRGERRDRLLLTLGTACVLLVGHPETGLHVSLLAAVFALSRLLARPAGERLALVRSWAVAAVLGAALAAPVALPAAEYLPQSLRVSLLESRRERLREGASEEAMPGRRAAQHGVVARLVPNAAPNAFGNNRFGAYWGDRNIVEDAGGFAGTAALLAALAALWPMGTGRRFPQERLMLAVALVCLVVVARPPGLTRVFELLPVLRHSLNFHSRVSLLLNFSVAYVAACTWERWRQGEVRWRAVAGIAAVLGALIVWAYLAHPGPDPEAWTRFRYGSLALQLAVLAATVLLGRRASMLLPLIAIELLAFHAPAHPPVPADLYYPVTPPIAFLEKRLDPWHRVAGLGPMLRPNFGSVYGFADPRSSNPAKPAAYLEAISRINRFPGRATDGFIAPEDPLYGLLGARFLMTTPRQWLPPPYRLVSRRGGAWVHQNRQALPLLFLPASATACPGPGWSACTAGVRDFGEQAVLRALPDPRPWAAADPASSLELGEIRPDWLRARALLTEPRLLASSVYQDGNWKLLLDGKPWPATVANGPFVASWLPAGDAGIDLLYRPASFALGLAVAALGLAAGAALWVPPPQTRERSQAHSTRSA